MATEIKAMNAQQFAQAGSVGRFAVKIEGCVGNNGGGVVNVIENPFGEDMLILEAYVAITTESSTDGDIHIGLADNIAGGNIDDSIVNSMVHSAVAIHAYELWTPADTGVSPLIWKTANAARTAVDSWIACNQVQTNDTSDLVYNLILVLAREADFN